ncbi:MAG: hypothetical protein DYG89_20815 [Caldilinea sp. CFX5]|nr:hypothetical protein [Caldilinea sp. CFX5]
MTLQPRLSRSLPLLILFSFLLMLLRFSSSAVVADANVLPDVQYTSATNTLTLGKTNSSQAATESITIPGLAALLASKNWNDLLVDQGSQTWLLKANLVIERSARLEATSATIKGLRLDSQPAAFITIIAERGGHLLIDGITVSSWDSQANAVDTTVANGRSYLLALEGGRMDILNSDVAYLGWQSGEPSGLSWRKRYKADDPTTGATGRLEDSKIHHNYFGMYSYEAYGLKILRNEVYDNIYYGIDPHDASQGFEVAYNKVYRNGTHGIIFSRLCENNTIHHNEVYNNGQHGIMLDRGTNNNVVYENLVYGNQDGIAIFQSSNNTIRNNTLRQNLRGIRINATFDSDDVYDGISANNQILDNLIEDSTEQGIYLYARADRNLFRGNRILRSGLQGFYIKSGGNRLENNIISNGGVGVTIAGGEYRDNPPQALPALDPSGDNNVIISTTITSNSDVGIRILGGSNNRIGPSLRAPVTDEAGNHIADNGKDGVAIGDAVNGTVATDNQVNRNQIHNNARHGVLVTDATSVRNFISQNSITGNGQLGIKVDAAAQAGIKPPVITTLSTTYVRGTTAANAMVEVYVDPGGNGRLLFASAVSELAAAGANQTAQSYQLTDYEGQRYLGAAQANANGVWEFQFSQAQNTDQISVLAIDGQGNTSAFSGSAKGGNEISIQIEADEHQQKRIRLKGTIGGEVTLADIKSKLGAADVNLLQELPNQVWLLNANLLVDFGVVLNLSPAAGVQELRLRSQASATRQAAIDYSSFVYIRTDDSDLNIDNAKVFSWDAQANGGAGDYDRDPSNGRAYLLAKYNSTMNIRNAEIGYLGSEDGESYGLSWRDINDPANPGELRDRVGGEVLNSDIHHNYYGIYTYQASHMVFRGNKFRDNILYGFDPHDFSHSFVVENNQAYNNGSHGFILSRGCHSFTLRNNISYNNRNPSDTSLAHGFMLDPGSPNSTDPQAPSYNNILENNEAYGNEGYGLRILGANTNEIRNNYFHDNEMGISVEQNSTGNVMSGNRLHNNSRFGLFIQETATKNVASDNEVIGNGDNGIYLRANENQIENNRVNRNAKAGIAILVKTGFAPPTNNELKANLVISNGANGIDLRSAVGTLVQGNLAEQNKGDGVYLKDSTQTAVNENTLRNNTGYGLEVNGPNTTQNTWSRNSLYANGLGAIIATGGAILLPPPQGLAIDGQTLTGTAAPNAGVEIFADTGTHAQYYVGRTTADGNGSFTFVAPSWPASNVTAINANASPLSAPATAAVVATPTPPVTPTPGVKLYLPVVQKPK